MPIREFDLIRWIQKQARRGPGVLTGIGDDCAILSPAAGKLCITTDAIVSGVDFEPDAPPLLVGRKAANVNFSDLAACGARADFLLLTLALPPGLGAAWARDVTRGVLAACRAARASLVGGDLTATSGPPLVSATALGSAARPVLRNGALPGHAIGVTGPCGGSILGRHLSFSPRLDLAPRLAKIASSMIDVSDGLTADLAHLLDASRCGAELVASHIPVHPDAKKLARKSGRPALHHALSDGEDFELLFTCPARRFPRFATRIGTVVRRTGMFLDGVKITPRGYEHVLA